MAQLRQPCTVLTGQFDPYVLALALTVGALVRSGETNPSQHGRLLQTWIRSHDNNERVGEAD